MPLRPTSERGRPWVMAAIVFGVSWFSIALTKNSAHIAPFWPGNAIALVALLRGASAMRRETWAAMLLAVLGANLAGGASVVLAVLFTVCNMVEVTAGYLLVRMPLGGRQRQHGRDARPLLRILATAVIAPAVGATLAVATIAPVLAARPIGIWLDWYLPSALATLIVLPIGLLIPWSSPRRPTRRQLVDVAICATLLFAPLLVILASERIAFMFLTAPAILFAGYRFRGVGAACATGIAALCTIPIASGDLGSLSFPQNNWSPQTLPLLVQAFLAVNCAGALLMATLLDERDALLATLAGREAAASARAKEKARLLMNVSHEIRTPLTAIIGLGELLSDRTTLDERQRRLVNGMMESAAQLQALAHDLLDTARVEAGGLHLALTRFDARTLLDDIVHHAVGTPQAGAKVTLHVDPGLQIWGDRDRVRQMAENLLSNALKYGGAAGEVVLSATLRGRRVRIEAKDRGPGFPSGKTHLAFEPFALTTGRAGPISAGVGLALVKMLAEAHGGAVGCQSAPHVETRVWVELPLESEKAPLPGADLADTDPAKVFPD